MSMSTSAGELFIIDDNPDNLGLLTRILREAGYGVRMANSGARALDAVRAHAPELVLLDINMPGMSGIEVCAALKQDPVTAHVPVIFLSALDDVNDKLRAFRSGGVDYVTKPFHAEEVLVRVETQLRLARLQRELVEKNGELEATNRQLLEARSQTEQVFAALSDVLSGMLLDGRYRLAEKIGAGGSAAVYDAIDEETGAEVALKVLRPRLGGSADPVHRRAAVEGISAVRVRHPNAVAVLGGGRTPAGISYIVMERLHGRTLGDEIAETGPLPLARVRAVFLPVCRALAEAHGAGVIHRDVKPSNVFLHRAPDGGEVVKVVDFGIADIRSVDLATDDRSRVRTATGSGELLGTPLFMSPERLTGQDFDGRADVYAVGMSMYFALAGIFPFRPTGGLGALIVACVNDPPLPLGDARPDLPAEAVELVMQTLSKRAVKRPTMAELASRIETAFDTPHAIAALTRRPRS